MAGGLDRGSPPPTARNPANLGEIVRLIAGFGGFLGRKSDGHPGPKAIWKACNESVNLPWGSKPAERLY